MANTLPTQLDACTKNELSLVPSGSLAMQRVPFVPSNSQRSNVTTLPSSTRSAGLPHRMPAMTSGTCESPLIVLNVSNHKWSAGDGGQPRITISGQGLQYLFQGLSDRGIALQSFGESVPRQSVGTPFPSTLEHSTVLPCSKAEACRSTLQITELNNVAILDNVAPVQCVSPTKHECVAVDGHLCESTDSPLLDDATVPASQTMAGAGFEMHHLAASKCQMHWTRPLDDAMDGGTNPEENSPTISDSIVSKSPMKSVAPEAESSCDVSFSQSSMSRDVPAGNGTSNTLSPSPSGHKSPSHEVAETSGNDEDCTSVPQSALTQCPLATLDNPMAGGSDLLPPTSLAEQVIVSVAKGLSEVASMLSKDPAVSPVELACAVQGGTAMTESAVEPTTSSSSLVLAERETQLVQMDDSDEELELPASTPGGVVVPAPPPLPVNLQATKRPLPSAGDVADMQVLCDSRVDDFNLGDLLSVPPSSDKTVFGEHISHAVTLADNAHPHLESRPLLQFGPKEAHIDPLTLTSATVCKRPVNELHQQEAPSPKKLKGRMTAEGGVQDGSCTLPAHYKGAYCRDAEEEGVRLEAEEGMGLKAEEKGVGLLIGEEVGHEVEADPQDVPMIPQSGCHEIPVAVHEGDSPFPAALPKETAQLSTAGSGCETQDDESDNDTDSGADESFTCLPHVPEDNTAFHTVPEQTLATSHEMENIPLYCLCPVPKDTGVLARPTSTALTLETAEMHSFETRENTHHIQSFAGSSRVELNSVRSAFNLSKPRLRVGLSRHARVTPLHRSYKRRQ